jgi:hypothetical protein
MRIKKIILPAILFCMNQSLHAQEFNFKVTNNWSDAPKLHALNKAFDSASAICVLDDRQTEYRIEGKEVNVYYTYHKIVAVKDDKGIEMANKMYIAVNDGSDLVSVKGRTVLKSGKVIVLDSSKINEIEEDGKKYKIFALEGLEKGAETEYTYTVRREISLFGNEIYQSAMMPTQEARFSLITPSHLRFSVKGYNGVQVSMDSLIGDKRIVVGYDLNIPELPEEKYAFRDKFLKRIDYKLSYNLGGTSGTTRLYTWKELAKKGYAIYTDRVEKEEKVLDAFVREMKIPMAGTEVEKIQAAEDYIKNSINIDKKLISKDADVLESIVKNKAADQSGTVKLFCGVFDKLNINYQIVFPGDRSGYGIDEELEDWNRLQDIIFYFPATAKYLSPMNVELRYPYIPFTMTATRGLFLKSTTIGTFKTAVGVWSEVKMEPFTEHSHNLEADIRFNETLDTLIIKSKQIFRGYGASGYRPIYVFLPKERQEAATKELIKSVVNSSEITNTEVLNAKLMDGGVVNKPLVISGEVKSTDLLENAGSKILFKIGDVIGPQVQMYQEKPRKLPVEIEYPHELNRKIIFHLPEGYFVENMKDLDFNVSYKEDGEETMRFVTAYTQKGNDIELNIYENYRRAYYPLSQFEDFKKVINSSADFNKITLVLKKK